MGQTLTHGIYLPDEGERNCYSGLAGNWSILDGAVGTIAEHTSALAGKAPLVHTHTKSDITDFPVYGTTAGTICEGNDSRLSDARTPVAHTHTKSDVTDLFNSANVWTDTNTFSSTLKQVNSAITKGTNPQSDIGAFNVYWGGTGVSNLTNALFAQRGYVYADGSTSYILYALENVSGGTHTSLSLTYDPNDTINKRYAFMRGDFRPYYDNSYNLGIPTHRWKSLNGINPGALSLPDYDSTAKLNLTSTFPAPDSNGNIYYTPTMSGWLYICFNISSATTIATSDSIFYIQAKDNNVANANFVQTSWMLKSGGTNSLAIFFPVVANKQFVIQINFTGYTLTKVFLIPGLGHVA